MTDATVNTSSPTDEATQIGVAHGVRGITIAEVNARIAEEVVPVYQLPWAHGWERVELSRWAPMVFGRHQGRVGRIVASHNTARGSSRRFVRLEWPDGPLRLSDSIDVTELVGRSDDECEWLRLKQECGDRQLAKIVAAPVVDVSSSGALQVLHEENVSTVPLAKKRTVGPTTNVRLVLSRAEMSVDQALAHDDGDSVFMLILRGKANGNEALSTARQHVDGMRRIATPWHRDGVHATPRVWRALAEVDKLGALAARLQLLAFARMALGEAGPTTAAKGMELPADMLRYTAERWLSAVADVAVLRRMRVIVPYLRGQRPDEHLGGRFNELAPDWQCGCALAAAKGNLGFVGCCPHCLQTRRQWDCESVGRAEQMQQAAAAAAAEMAVKMAQLMEIGFGEAASRIALERTGARLEAAIELLIAV